jgi:acyl-CoA hydrolase
VKVEIYIEQMYSNHRKKQELYTFVALDENKKNKKFSMIT